MTTQKPFPIPSSYSKIGLSVDIFRQILGFPLQFTGSSPINLLAWQGKETVPCDGIPSIWDGWVWLEEFEWVLSLKLQHTDFVQRLISPFLQLSSTRMMNWDCVPRPDSGSTLSSVIRVYPSL